jgi:hypothetical protein
MMCHFTILMGDVWNDRCSFHNWKTRTSQNFHRYPFKSLKKSSVETLFCTVLPDIWKCIALFGGPMVGLLVLMIKWRCTLSTGGMMLTGDNRSTCRKTRLSATLSTINLTWNGLGSKPGLYSQRLATNLLRHGMAFWSTTLM